MISISKYAKSIVFHAAIRNGDVIGFNINAGSCQTKLKTTRNGKLRGKDAGNRLTVQIDVNMRRIDNQTVSSWRSNQVVLQNVIASLANGSAICQRNGRAREAISA